MEKRKHFDWDEEDAIRVALFGAMRAALLAALIVCANPEAIWLHRHEEYHC